MLETTKEVCGCSLVPVLETLHHVPRGPTMRTSQRLERESRRMNFFKVLVRKEELIDFIMFLVTVLIRASFLVQHVLEL